MRISTYKYMIRDVEAAKKRGKELEKAKALFPSTWECVEGFSRRNGCSRFFQVYIDDKGVGACAISAASAQRTF